MHDGGAGELKAADDRRKCQDGGPGVYRHRRQGVHDIGKNLVKIMLEGSVEVIDLGVDVTPEQVQETAKRQRCGVIACSSLLTTTMGEMSGGDAGPGGRYPGPGEDICGRRAHQPELLR